MRYNSPSQTITTMQDNLYNKLNSFSKQNKSEGRLCSIPVCIIDIVLDITKTTVIAIEELFHALIHLSGAISSSDELKLALYHAEKAWLTKVQIPVKIAIAPVKIFFQFFAIAIDPESVEPFCNYSFFVSA